MSNKVVYFPYMSVPSSAWFTRSLLYWDSVATIVPLEQFSNPAGLNEYTQDLLQAGLVEPIFPGQYTYRSNDFATAFIDLANNSDDLGERQEQFSKNSVVEIHAEKLSDVGLGLVDLKLAKTSDRDGWYLVEKITAEEFMCYLATFLGQLPDLDYVPITDQIRSLNRLASFDSHMTPVQKNVNELRIQILEHALPSPRTAVSGRELMDFKERYYGQLSRFRNEIEMELTLLADINDVSLGQRRLDLLRERITIETEEIVHQMKSHGWLDIGLGKLCPLLALVPGVGYLPKVVSAVYKALADVQPVNKRSPWAYAAFAQNLRQ